MFECRKDTIIIMHEDSVFKFDVEAKPSNAVCVVDTDVEVDFDSKGSFVPFNGTSWRLSEK